MVDGETNCVTAKQIVVYPYNRTLLNKKDRTSEACNDTDKSEKCNAKKKPDSKVTYCVVPSMCYLDNANLIHNHRK